MPDKEPLEGRERRQGEGEGNVREREKAQSTRESMLRDWPERKERRKGECYTFQGSEVMVVLVKTQKGRVTQTESHLENCQLCFIALKKDL